MKKTMFKIVAKSLKETSGPQSKNEGVRKELGDASERKKCRQGEW